MAARGNSSKEIVFKTMLNAFKGAFMENDKILRIPLVEDGEPIEIKVSLTAAKDILGGASANDKPPGQSMQQLPWRDDKQPDVPALGPKPSDWPTKEQQQQLKQLMKYFGLLEDK